jgi:hypothetical protein
VENSFNATRESKGPATPSDAKKTWDEDRGLRLKRRAVVMLAAGAMPLAVWVLGRFPGAVENIYTDRIGQYVGRTLARVSSMVPFSLAETLMVVLVLSGVGAGTLAMYHVARGLRRFTNAILCGVLRLGAVAGGRGYEELLPHSTEMSLGGNVKARILNLETLIEIKEATGGEKDVAVLPLLRRTLREKR